MRNVMTWYAVEGEPTNDADAILDAALEGRAFVRIAAPPSECGCARCSHEPGEIEEIETQPDSDRPSDLIKFTR